MSINELESKVRELRQLQALIEEAQQEAEAIEDAIKAAMGDTEEIRAGEYRISWKPITSSRIDTAPITGEPLYLIWRHSSPRSAPSGGSALHEPPDLKTSEGR